MSEKKYIPIANRLLISSIIGVALIFAVSNWDNIFHGHDAHGHGHHAHGEHADHDGHGDHHGEHHDDAKGHH